MYMVLRLTCVVAVDEWRTGLLEQGSCGGSRGTWANTFPLPWGLGDGGKHRQKPVFNLRFWNSQQILYDITQVWIIPPGSWASPTSLENCSPLPHWRLTLYPGKSSSRERVVQNTCSLVKCILWHLSALQRNPHPFHITDDDGIPVAGAKTDHSLQFHWSQPAAEEQAEEKKKWKKKKKRFQRFQRFQLLSARLLLPTKPHGHFASSSLHSLSSWGYIEESLKSGT